LAVNYVTFGSEHRKLVVGNSDRRHEVVPLQHAVIRDFLCVTTVTFLHISRKPTSILNVIEARGPPSNTWMIGWPHSPPQTTSASNQPFCHNTLCRPTDRPTDRQTGRQTDGPGECSVTWALRSLWW